MSYTLTRKGRLIVRTALLNNNSTSLTSVEATSVNDFKIARKHNTLTHLRIYY